MTSAGVAPPVVNPNLSEAGLLDCGQKRRFR